MICLRPIIVSIIRYVYLIILTSYHILSRWENPLMGWTSTGDPYANVGEAGISFDSEEAAKAFAEKHGWEYEVISSLACTPAVHL